MTISFIRTVRILSNVFSRQVNSRLISHTLIRNNVVENENKEKYKTLNENPSKVHPSSINVNAEKVREMLKSNFDLTDQRINRLLTQHPHVRKLTERMLARYLLIFKKYSINILQVQKHPNLFTMLPEVLQNTIIIMNEALIPIYPPTILIFRVLYRQSIGSLKEEGYIPSYTDCITRFAKILNFPEDVKSRIIDELPKDINAMRLLDLRILFMSHYITWILETDKQSAIKLIELNNRIHYKSFEFIKGNFEILTNDFNFSKERILKNGFLLYADPYNLVDILSDVKTLGTVSIKELALKRPKILLRSCESLHEIHSICKEHGVVPEALSKTPGILTLSTKTIKSRFNLMSECPELSPFKAHPRVTFLVYYQKRALRRINELKEKHLPIGSLQQLSANSKEYERFMVNGQGKSGQVDILYLCKKYFEKSLEEIKIQIKKHPHWNEVHIMDVDNSLEYLHNLKLFSKDQIFNSITILFYSKSKLEKEIPRMVSLNDPPINSPLFFEMALYNLEKDHHFTGDGIWDELHPRLTPEEKAQIKKQREIYNLTQKINLKEFSSNDSFDENDEEIQPI